MNTVYLTDEMVPSFQGFIPADIAENIGRSNYRGLVITEDERPLSGMVWEIHKTESTQEVKTVIHWLVAADQVAFDALFAAYKDEVMIDEVDVSTFVIPAQDMQDSKPLWEKAGFTVELMEDDRIVATLSQVAALPYFQEPFQSNSSVYPLRDMTQQELSFTIRKMESLGLYGRSADLKDLPILWFDLDVSNYYSVDEIPSGLILFHLLPSGRLIAEMMAASGKNSTRIFPYLIGCSLKAALEKYGEDMEIVIDRHNHTLLALGEKLFPHELGIPVYIGSRKE